jgi:hypothetical protein
VLRLFIIGINNYSWRDRLVRSYKLITILAKIIPGHVNRNTVMHNNLRIVYEH